MTKLTEKIYDDTSSNALWTSIFFYISFSFSLSENLDLALTFMMAFSILAGLVLFILSERITRKWVSLVRFSDFIEIESKRVSYISPKIGKISFLISIIIIMTFNFLLEWVPLVARLVLVIISSLGIILYFLSVATEHTPIMKKDVPKELEVELAKLLDRITKKKKID